jgi:hypothetical protein
MLRRTLWAIGGIIFALAAVVGAVFLGDPFGLFERFRLKPDSVIVERQPDVLYEQLFPYYVELCTVSQVRRLDGSRGNPFGHAAMYLKGACKDETAPFPQLRRCRHVATDLDDPEHGAGVSVGRWFRNINWVAVPGHELFYNGNLKNGERLDQTRFDAAVQAAIDKDVFHGVEFHGGWTRNPNASLRDYIADQSITTDFALQFARNVFCARVPVTEPVLDEVIAFLNDKNREYATGKADYNWNLFTDNCVHTVRNALAAVNAWEPISVRQLKILSLLNLAVPAHEFVNLGVLGSEGPLDDYREIFDEAPSRDSLNDFNWLPTRHGALVKALPVHAPNDIYSTDFALFTVQSPFRMTKTGHVVELLSDKRTVDLEENLRAFVDRYDSLLARDREELEGLATVRGDPFRRFGRVYYDYIQQQRDDAADKLARLIALKRTPSPQASDGHGN